MARPATLRSVFNRLMGAQQIPVNMGAYPSEVPIIEKVVEDVEKILKVKYKKYRTALLVEAKRTDFFLSLQFSLSSGDARKGTYKDNPIADIRFNYDKPVREMEILKIYKFPEWHTIKRTFNFVFRRCPTALLARSPVTNVEIRNIPRPGELF